MLESYTRQIKNCLQYLQNFYKEDKDNQREIYLEKLEKALQLSIMVFLKYEKEKKYSYNYYDSQWKQTIYIILFVRDEGVSWQFNYDDQIKGLENNISTQELVKYCWENQMDIKSLISGLFQYINNIMSKKSNVIRKEKEKYDTEISCLDEAIINLQELIDFEISEDIKNR